VVETDAAETGGSRMSVMLSIRPEWIDKILSGEKTIEVRKTRPKVPPPFTVYIYCTKPKFEHEDFFVTDAGTNKIRAFHGGGKVVAEFFCDEIVWHGGESLIVKEDREAALDGSCLSREQLFEYLHVSPGSSVYDKRYEFYCWHISDLKVYDEPKTLNDFYSQSSVFENDAQGHLRLTGMNRPPQSWCYAEER